MLEETQIDKNKLLSESFNKHRVSLVLKFAKKNQVITAVNYRKIELKANLRSMQKVRFKTH